MSLYIAAFCFAAIGALWTAPNIADSNARGDWCQAHRRDPIMWLFAATLVLFVGLRHEVSSDWYRYEELFDLARHSPLRDVFLISDPGFMLLNWLVGVSGLGFSVLLFFCALVAITGLTLFSRTTPNPWLVFTVAVSHYVIVMSMGHVRQSTAIGFVLIGIVELNKGTIRRYVLWTLVATTFHKSAFIFLLIAVIISERRTVTMVLWTAAICVSVYILLVADQLDVLTQRYVVREYEAAGAIFRVMLNVPPAVAFLFLRRRMPINAAAARFWHIMSLLSLALAALLFVFPSTAAVDRLAKYCIPLQMFIYAWLPVILFKDRVLRIVASTAVVTAYGVFLITWLTMSPLAQEYWIPYRSVLTAR